jgi:predicted RNA-binding protein YlxR (DUF448 family)
VGCRTSSAKREFVRIVRTPEGAVVVDATGKASGRGAYLCAKRECWDEALKRGRLASALRTSISSQDAEALRQHAEQLDSAARGSNS